MVGVTLVLVVAQVAQLSHLISLDQENLLFLADQFMAKAELDLKLAHNVLLELLELETVEMELAQEVLELQFLDTQLAHLPLLHL
jgi:hypothetical protein